MYQIGFTKFLLPNISEPFPFNMEREIFESRVRVAYMKVLGLEFWSGSTVEDSYYANKFEALVSSRDESGWRDDVFQYWEMYDKFWKKDTRTKAAVLGVHGFWNTPIPEIAGLLDPALTRSEIKNPPLNVWKSPSGRLYVHCATHERWEKLNYRTATNRFQIFWEVTENELTENGEIIP